MRLVVAGILLALLTSFTAFADDKADQDEAFDDAVQEFGFNAGLALQCTPDAEKKNMEGEVLKAYNGLARLFGTDQAFAFAAAFGAGAQDEVNKTECDSYIRKFTDSMKPSIRAE